MRNFVKNKLGQKTFTSGDCCWKWFYKLLEYMVHLFCQALFLKVGLLFGEKKD